MIRIILICAFCLICFGSEERTVEVRAYCLCEKCTSKELVKISQKDRRTANGNHVFVDGVFQKGLAVPKDGPIMFGTLVSVPEYGEVMADDTGGWINCKWHQNKELYIEVRFETHQDALDWGVKKLKIKWEK